MLDIRELRVRFHDADHDAVRGISLQVADGEMVGLVGESGSGKTVTAMVISSLLPENRATATGQVLLDGTDLLALSDGEIRRRQGREIGVVFQEPMTALNPVLPIGPQVSEALRVHTDLPARERRRRAIEALAEVELADPETVYRKYPHQLSGGQLQRVCIAAAIISAPRLLLADEPTTALDVTVQAQILELLRRLNAEKGMSVLFISHNLHVVRKLCHRVAVMERGQIVEQGATEQVFSHPAAPYTRRLIAAIPTREKL